MTENPYRLTRDIRGIGFRTADAIAMLLEDGDVPTSGWRLLRLGGGDHFEQPCEFAFTSRQIEIERTRGLSYARSAIDNLVNHN
jgi:hypothetical protein